MNVFVIPSWYPNRVSPIEGIFNKEHALGIGALRPDWRVAISNWGQTETLIRLKHPERWPDVARWCREVGRLQLADNVWEYRHPALLWSGRIFGGRREAIVRACRANLSRVEADLGPVDVLHAFGGYPGGWVAMRLHDDLGLPYVISEMMGGYPYPYPSLLAPGGGLKPELEEPLRRAGARTGVGLGQIARMEELGVRDVQFVPLMVDESRFTNEPPPAVPPVVFLTVARLEPDKGIGDLLEAARILLGSLPGGASPVRFRIAGNGDTHGWSERARSLGVGDVVEFLGLLDRDAVRRELRGCHAVVHPSHREAGCTACIETLAAGRPLIATRCGAPEFIVTPETGVLVGVGRPTELADALRTFVADPFRFDPGTIRQQFLQRFSRPVIADLFESAYRKAIAASRP